MAPRWLDSDQRRGANAAQHTNGNGHVKDAADLVYIHRNGSSNGNGHALVLNKEQHEFIESLNEMARFLDSQGISRNSWMAIAGGAVFLYQLDGSKHSTHVDRVPTDLDIVIDDTSLKNGKHILDHLGGELDPLKVELRKEPLEHYGHILSGPALSTFSSTGLPIDIITELSQTYSPSHPFRPSAEYVYPPSSMLIAQSRKISHELLDGEIRIAHPGFIAFYKLMLARNHGGKQDLPDLKRLKAMGHFTMHPANRLHYVLETMCQSDKDLVRVLEAQIEKL